MKIRITDLPKYQFRGLFGKKNSLNLSGTDSFGVAFERALRSGVLGVSGIAALNTLQDKKKKKPNGLLAANWMNMGLNAFAGGLEKAEQERFDRNRSIYSGFTDTYFPTVTNITSRGTTEINTGEMFPNQKVPVQFKGTPYFGSAQAGALIPTRPYTITDLIGSEMDNPEINYQMLNMRQPARQSIDFSNNDVVRLDGEQMDVDAVLDALASSEGGSTGKRTNLVGPQGQRASALGRWQIIDRTRAGIYNAYFRDRMSQEEFEQRYNTDPEFERLVAKKHVESLLPRYGSLVFGAWYNPGLTDKFMRGDESVLNQVPGRDYGNKITWGAYLKNAQNKYFKITNSKFEEGGEYELDENEINYILANGGQIEYL